MICLSPEFKLNGNIIKKSQINVTQNSLFKLCYIHLILYQIETVLYFLILYYQPRLLYCTTDQFRYQTYESRTPYGHSTLSAELRPMIG